ncbi:uncharacterized protein LOC128669731 [Plodia interpunctella]|uniref:uncharacterized protein LOC128669731 n=1 Tax=Plodia interpunctella TaxID=58824 RepID=UPI00310143F9
MWDTVLMFVFLCILSYFFWKITQNEPNKIKFYFKFFVFYFITSVFALFIWPVFLLSPRNPTNILIGVWLPKQVTKLYDITWNLRNGEILSEDRGAVIVANHQSALDILGMFNIWSTVKRMTAIAKKEIFYVWPFGLAAYLAGVVFIDRSNPKDSYKTLEVTSDVMVKNKTKIWLFPEGTRNKDYTKFLPFKKGAFIMAVNAQVPILPVVFSPYYFINRKKYIFNRGQVTIQCLEPIPTEGLTLDDVPKLMDTVHEKMASAYKELAKEVLSALPSDYPYTTVGTLHSLSYNQSSLSYSFSKITKIIVEFCDINMFRKITNLLFFILSKFFSLCFIILISCIDFMYKKTIYNKKNKRICFYYNFFMVYVGLIVGSILMSLIFILRPGYEGNISIAAPLTRYFARLLGVPVTIRNKERLSTDSGAIVTINHQSLFDIIVSLGIWDIPKKMISLGKRELMYVPPYGPMALLAGLQFVPRNNSLKAREQLNIIAQHLKDRKVKMVVFPEGTRNDNRAEFLPFKKGAFHTAVIAQIPIIPIVVSPYYFLNSKKKIFGTGSVIIEILEPLSTEGLTQADVPALTEKVRNLMFKTYQELTKEVLEAETDQESIDLGSIQKLL